MQLSHEAQTGGDHVRSVGTDRILLASGERRSSFVIAAGSDAFDWPVRDARTLTAADCEPLLAQAPAVVILGTGPRQVFPPRDVLATFLTRRVGVEFMDNAAAARTYNVLLGEGRKVAAAFILA
ncbi:MAG TPA: MTH938/NDUFAF3 family protein [Patescibacteria group bacterium]|nr:MTH938/NDUFAF3 family protein [Patescibacteria group bacterium]